MALPPQTHENFFREVDEEVRRDQFVGFFRRWGKWLAAFVILALAMLGAGIGWREYRHRQADQQGEAMAQAIDQMIGTTPQKAAPQLAELRDSGVSGYRITARLSEADLALERGDTKAAVAAYGAIASDDAAPQPYRDLALVRQTAAEYDSLKPQAIIDRLSALAAPGSAWLGSAGEMMAIAYIRMGKEKEAGRILQSMARDPAVPETIRQRAVQLGSGIGVEIAPAAAPGASGNGQ